MQLFLKKVISFLTPTLFLMFGLEYFLRKTPNDYSYKSDFIADKGQFIKTLILGSSHAYYGINPLYMDSAFNASYVSQSLYFDFLILQKSIIQLPNLENIILTISPFSFTRKLNTLEERWRKYNYYYYFNIIPSTVKITDYKRYFVLSNVGIKKGVELSWEAFLHDGSLVKCNEFGWGINENDGKKCDFKKNAKESVKRRTSTGDDFSFGVFWTDKIVKLAKDNNKKIIFIQTPKHKTYDNIYPLNRQEKMLDIINNYLVNYDNVYYYDFNYYLDDEMFFDSHHLNKNGASVYSEKLNDFISEIDSLIE